MTEEIDLDELERRVRSKWSEDLKPAPALAEEDRAVAVKLMGRDNARRMARMPSGKRFRYVAPVITAEYFYAAPGESMGGIQRSGGWTINIFENGVKRSTTPGLREERCMFIVREIRKKGIEVRLFETEAMKRAAAERRGAPSTRPTIDRQPSRRMQMIAQLKDFHL
jgi:hypothetical protein